MDKTQVIIAAATRTPIGAFQGVLSPATAPQLGSAAIAGAVTRAGIDRRMRALIEAGVTDGSIRACDTRMTAFALAGALNWMGHWYREDATLKPLEIADRFIDVFNRGLRGSE